MARLNDIPISIESIDALKRRFTRQNRDLARTNSAQSLRIRNLETEISRLLSENISLRETAIASQKEADRWKSQYGLADEVRSMKSRLERQLKEVSSLVDELGSLPDKAAQKEQKRRKSTHGILGEARSPTAPDWRNKQTIAGVLSGAAAEQDGRLPPIVEDKLYPRRTLEPLEIQDLVGADGDPNQSESPDLGPPPVAHFDVAEPIHFRHDNEAAGSPENEDERMVQLPSNLETRRKRRTSSLLRDMTTSEGESDAEKPSLFKSGAKRKLDISELEDHAAPAPSSTENEEFVFHRRPAMKPGSNRKTSRFSRPNQGDIIIPATNAAVSPQKSKNDEKERKVLAPKSSNSPSKRSLQDSGKPDPTKPDASNRPTRLPDLPSAIERPPISKAPSASVSRPPPRKPRPEVEPSEVPKIEDPSDLPPKTPFLPTDILSPPSSDLVTSAPPSAPSISRAPSEAAIINSVEDVLSGSIGRASRRAKAAVSYAQPNLRDKMRRPGKEMVGAVEGIKGSAREGSIGSVLSRSTSEAPEVKVKKEESIENEERWQDLPLRKREKEEPTSPLSDKKTAATKVDRDPERERDRANAIRRHAQARREQKALLDAESEAGKEKGEDVADQQNLRVAVERLSIFDPPGSSPSTGGDASRVGSSKEPPSHNPKSEPSAPNKRKMNVGAIGREAGRRHSLAPSSSNLAPNAAKHSANLDPSKVLSNISSSTSTTSKPLVGLPRSASVAGMRPDKVRSAAERELGGAGGGGGLKRSNSVAVLKGQQQQQQRGQITAGLPSGGEEMERGERVATRRRSMMV